MAALLSRAFSFPCFYRTPSAQRVWASRVRATLSNSEKEAATAGREEKRRRGEQRKVCDAATLFAKAAVSTGSPPLASRPGSQRHCAEATQAPAAPAAAPRAAGENKAPKGGAGVVRVPTKRSSHVRFLNTAQRPSAAMRGGEGRRRQCVCMGRRQCAPHAPLERNAEETAGRIHLLTLCGIGQSPHTFCLLFPLSSLLPLPLLLSTTHWCPCGAAAGALRWRRWPARPRRASWRGAGWPCRRWCRRPPGAATWRRRTAAQRCA